MEGLLPRFKQLQVNGYGDDCDADADDDSDYNADADKQTNTSTRRGNHTQSMKQRAHKYTHSDNVIKRAQHCNTILV